MKKLHILSIALCIILLGACSKSSNTPKGTVEKYLDYVKSEKFDKAVKCFYIEEEAQQSEIDALAAKMKAGYEKTSGIEKYVIESETLQENTGQGFEKATVVAKIYYKDNTEEIENYQLLKDNGEWKIDLSSK